MDPVKLATKRRRGVFKDNKFLLTNFEGSLQQKDLDKTKGQVKGAVEDFYRVKTNIKPKAWKKYQETGDPKVLMFDFNWWPIKELGGKPEQWNNVFVYQLKGCNLACPFCFVDNHNNNGQVDHGARYFSMEEIIDVFVKKREELKQEGKELNVFRMSGGEPSLVPEQWLQALQEFEKRGLSNEIYVQSDTNLVTSSAMDYWRQNGELNPFIFNKITEYKNFGILACFKGTDPSSFAENTRAPPEFFDEQFVSFDNLIHTGIKVYPHLINPNPDTLENFMERLEEDYSEEIWPMLHLYGIGADYEPIQERLKKQGKNPEEQAKEWKENYTKAEEILEKNLQERFGVSYKRISRPETIDGFLEIANMGIFLF